MQGHGRGGASHRRSSWNGRADSFLEADLDALAIALEPFAIILGSDTRERLKAFARDLLEWNERLNLLSRSDAPAVINKHVAASIGVFLAVPPNTSGRWLDVGTGAGFPGLILKMLAPDLDMTLLDSARKRCLFLENVVRKLGLGRVPVLPIRIETLVARGTSIGAYSVITSRAVSALGETLRACAPLLRQQGRLVTFKGPQWGEELAAARDAGDLDSGGYELEAAVRVPWTAGHLLSLLKTAPVEAPERFEAAAPIESQT